MKSIEESMHFTCMEWIITGTYEAKLNNWNGVILDNLDVHVDML